jgi:hypothetical protein
MTYRRVSYFDGLDRADRDRDRRNDAAFRAEQHRREQPPEDPPDAYEQRAAEHARFCREQRLDPDTGAPLAEDPSDEAIDEADAAHAAALADGLGDFDDDGGEW